MCVHVCTCICVSSFCTCVCKLVYICVVACVSVYSRICWSHFLARDIFAHNYMHTHRVHMHVHSQCQFLKALAMGPALAPTSQNREVARPVCAHPFVRVWHAHASFSFCNPFFLSCQLPEAHQSQTGGLPGAGQGPPGTGLCQVPDELLRSCPPSRGGGALLPRPQPPLVLSLRPQRELGHPILIRHQQLPAAQVWPQCGTCMLSRPCSCPLVPTC